jgi:hypothetical protein
VPAPVLIGREAIGKEVANPMNGWGCLPPTADYESIGRTGDDGCDKGLALEHVFDAVKEWFEVALPD